MLDPANLQLGQAWHQAGRAALLHARCCSTLAAGSDRQSPAGDPAAIAAAEARRAAQVAADALRNSVAVLDVHYASSGAAAAGDEGGLGEGGACGSMQVACEELLLLQALLLMRGAPPHALQGRQAGSDHDLTASNKSACTDTSAAAAAAAPAAAADGGGSTGHADAVLAEQQQVWERVWRCLCLHLGPESAALLVPAPPSLP